MCSTDVAPNRLTAAEKAAADFIRAQPGGSRIGLVTFAGVAGLLVPPTDDTDKLLAALKTLTTSRGTAIGQGILASIDAIADVDPTVPPTGANLEGAGPGQEYAADVIVVLTDGANTQGVDPQTAAKEAAARRLRVYTIGFGTTTPSPMVCSSSQVGDSPFGGGGFGGGFGGGGGGGRFGDRRPQTIDEDALRQVAGTTGGSYYRAQNAGQLQDALTALPRNITVTHKHKDIAAVFAGVGALFVAAAIALSLWWNRVRLPPSRSGPARESG
jgi:Ca-activated chloride channel family protein